MAGRWVDCPLCGMQFAAMSDEPLDAEVGYSSYGVDNEVPPRSNTMLFGWLLTGFVGLLACVFLVIALNRSGDQQGPKPAPKTQELRPRVEPAAQPLPSLVREEPSTFLGIAVTVWIFLLCLFIAYWVGVILLLAWVARDARARSVDGGGVWVIAILLTGWIAFLVYLASRPYGMLVVCQYCSNKRLHAAVKCPHCGHA